MSNIGLKMIEVICQNYFNLPLDLLEYSEFSLYTSLYSVNNPL